MRILLLLLTILFIGGTAFGGYYVYNNIITKSDLVDTSGWETYQGKNISFKHPKEWVIKIGGDDYFQSGKELVGLGIPDALNAGGTLVFIPGSSVGSTLCQESNKNSPSTVKFEKISGRTESNKCIFTNLKSNVDEFNGFVYMYNFKNKKGEETVGLDVRTSQKNGDLENELDTLVNTLEFKSDEQK